MKALRAVLGIIAAATWAGIFAAPDAGAQYTHVTLAGAGKGANAFQAMAAMAEATNRNSKTVRATNRESAGFIENVRLLAAGRVEIVMSSGPFVDFWQRKMWPFEKDKADRTTTRGVGPAGTAPFHMAVLKDSGIKSYYDLVGKRVNMGPKGSNTVFMTEFITKALGIDDKIRKDYLGWTQAATNLVDRKLDAFGIPNPIGAPSILQAAEGAPIRILNLPEEAINKFIQHSGAFFKARWDASMYKGMEGQSFTTVDYMPIIVASVKAPADVVYEVTRHSYDPKNRDFMVNIAIGWKLGLEQAKNQDFIKLMKSSNLKLHPGAARYWKERGYTVD